MSGNGWIDDLQNVQVSCDPSLNIIDVLRDLGNSGKLNGWIIQPLGIPGANPWCLAFNDIKVALSIIYSNQAMTSNVIPTDNLQNAAASNAVTKTLYQIFLNNSQTITAFIS
ncbi:hypothetical protein LW139_07495 [Proteus vulgaris]|uniref:hypothetical protein n=1 Tax=Proteus vulgaris TaxID=585 RepID=UPI001FFF00AA|nr:hypothetical protein [Proteus vulgaris]UPK82523.1 hypothetical protein LW139_07495 [Proteus vulgaris]